MADNQKVANIVALSQAGQNVEFYHSLLPNSAVNKG